MSKETKRLGRGLSSLISSDIGHPEASGVLPGRVAAADEPRPLEIPIEQIRRNPYQPRTDFDERGMESLSRSIRHAGVIQPLVVRKQKDGWELIAGERRLRAAIQAGLNSVPAVVRESSDQEVLELALIENIHREDLNAIERAKAYRRYADEFHLPVEEIAGRVGEDRSTVANYLRLLELSEEIQGLVAGRSLSMGHARCLLGISGDAERKQLAEAIIHNELSVRAVEDIARRRKSGVGPEGGEKRTAKSVRPLVQSIQEALIGGLGLKVRIKERRKPNTGQIVIDYQSLDDFRKITEMLGYQGG